MWGCGRSIYRGIQTDEGQDVIDDYDVSEDDQTFIGEQLVRHLGSFEAILDHFANASFTVPPLTIITADCQQSSPTARPA